MEFKPWPKTPRYSRDIIITEKIDGTNACVMIGEDGKFVHAQSRNKIVTPGKQTDNCGFAAWCEANKSELEKLGPGYHYGEWWGKGINRGYGIEDKRFSLFNAGRWNAGYQAMLEGHENDFPKCCHVVPIVYSGPHVQTAIDQCIFQLSAYGSDAAPGFMNPEGVIIYHTASGQVYKKTLKDDEKGKAE